MTRISDIEDALTLNDATWAMQQMEQGCVVKYTPGCMRRAQHYRWRINTEGDLEESTSTDQWRLWKADGRTSGPCTNIKETWIEIDEEDQRYEVTNDY